MSELVVRPAARGDFAQWLPLWEGYNAFYERTVAPEVTQTTWGRFFDAYEPMHALVAERDGRLVGLVHYLFHRNTAMIQPTCYLQDLFVDPKTRAKGVGKQLVDWLVAEVKAQNWSRLYWATAETNYRARGLYDKYTPHSGFLRYVVKNPEL